MAVQAAITQYKKEMVLTYEQRRSKLSAAATKETMMNGYTVTWLVSGAGSAVAVTRGQNGDIPYGGPRTLRSRPLWSRTAPAGHDQLRRVRVAGNQTQLMQINSYAIIRRAQDQAILDELANATQDWALGGSLTIEMISAAKAILGNQNVPIDEEDNMFAIISPAAQAYLEQTTEFASPTTAT